MEYKVIGWTNNDDENYPATDIDSKEMYDAIIADIRANNYVFTGQDHHYGETCTPVLNNGKRVCCGQREWGGIMADAHGVDDWDGRAYIYYFLRCNKEKNFPPDYVDDSAIVKDFVEPKHDDVKSWDDATDGNQLTFMTRQYEVMNFSAERFFIKDDEYYELAKKYDNDPAIVASLIMERAYNSKNALFAVNACMAVSDIIACWLTEDKTRVRDERLSHLEEKLERGRVEKTLCELCPAKYQTELKELCGDLIPVMAFLLEKSKFTYNQDARKEFNEIFKRISKHLENIFEYCYFYQIDSVRSLVPKDLIEATLVCLKPDGGHYMEEALKAWKNECIAKICAEKHYLTDDEIIALSVGSVYNEVDDNGILHLYRCKKEQMEAYARLSKTLGEWSGRTNGVRLDFVTDSSFISFKVINGKKYELFVNGVKEDHIELAPGEVFTKILNTEEGENRVTLIFPSHEAGAISSLALSVGASYRRYEHKFGKKILFIGDSITQGWDTVSDSNSYAYQVSLRYDADTVIFGVGGAYFHESILPSEDDYHPDIVIVAFGANDFGRGLEALQKNMPEFLDKLLSVYKNSQIIGLTPISGRAGASEKASPFREFIAQTYEKYGITYIDGSEMVSPGDENYADSYHPNDEGYLEMTDNLIPKLDAIIN